jgi:tape measure domain-containing protein
MAGKLSFSIAVNLLTENFKKGANTVKNSFRSMQMQILTFAAALGAGSLGISGLLTRFKEIARDTSRVLTALKNVSGGVMGFSDNLRFVNDLAAKYGLEVNALTGNFAKFTASATQANMPIEEQKKVFESLSKASTAFGLSAEDTNGVFLALSQMMGKGTIQSQELKTQMGEKLPIAIQAMAKAANTSVAGLGKLMEKGKLLSSEMIPRLADALNEMIPNVSTDNLEASLNRLSNAFGEIVNSSGFQEKYKALIDWLTGAIKTAGNNIRNIIVGIVAAIGFVVTAGLTKVYAGYAANGKKIIANEQITSRKMRTSVQEYVAAKKRLSDLELQYAQANAQKQIALARRVEEARLQVQGRAAAARMAITDRVAAHDAAANIKAYGRLGTIGAMFAGTAKKIGAAMKSMWTSFGPAIIITAIIAVIGYFKNLYDEAKRIKNIFKEYRQEVENAGNTEEVKMLKAQLEIMRDKTRSEEETIAAQKTLQKMLGDEKLSQEQIIEKIEEKIELIKASAKAELLAHEMAEREIAIRKRARSLNIPEKRLRELADKKNSPEEGDRKEYEKLLKETDLSVFKGEIFGDASKRRKIRSAVDETVEDLKVISDATKDLDESLVKKNALTVNTTDNPEPDDKALRAAEKRLEALRKLDEEDRKRQIEKQKFDLDMQQKAIDLMDDSFEKRTKQTILNLEKEKLEVDEFQNNLLKQQQAHLKTKYESVHGTDKGFGAYYETLTSDDLQNTMPEGLRPSDIAGKVKELTDAAQAAREKGLKDINKDLSLMLKEQELMFASDLERKLAELDAYYNEQRIKAGDNAELTAQIEANRKRGKLEAVTDDKIQKLDFSEQLENERAAGLESIGMTELVEEKKLEITKKYLQLKIEALQKSADAGNEDAKNQIKLYQESLKKLDTTKPAKSLKALADKALFDRIKKGFEKAGDSADKAEEKTTKLLSSISQKAQTIANIASELQSMFGGISEELDEALSAVGNIASGFAQGGIVGGAMAVIGETIKIINKTSEAGERLREIADARLESQRAYNLLLLEQNLLMKEAVSIFGEKQITRASNAMRNYWDIQKQLGEQIHVGSFVPNPDFEKQLKEMASSSKDVISSLGKMQLNEYYEYLKYYNKGLSGLGSATIVNGSYRGNDVYQSILTVYDDVIDAEGKLNKERIQSILKADKMSDTTRKYLENLLSLTEAAEAARLELDNYLQSTFGALGDDLMTSLENAIKDRGVNAWEEFGKAGAKVIEQLGKQIAYELFFADKFKDLQNDLKAIYESSVQGETEAERAKRIGEESSALIGNFYQGIGKDMEHAQGFMENWKTEAEKYDLDLWASDASNSQTASTGKFESMDQDTGNRLLGIFNAMHMVGLQMKDILSPIAATNSSIHNITVSISEELQKHTVLFNEIKSISQSSFYQIEGTKEALKNISATLERIDKNTGKL